MTNRRILRISGRDTRDFLQGLVTNDVSKLDSGMVYAALLTPQGKYIADFFLIADGQDVLLDVAEGLGDMVTQRLSMYKLRAAVEIATTELHMHRGLGDAPDDGLSDPRHTALGWRAYRERPQSDDAVDWENVRVTHMIPETGIELSGDTFILEAGFERLSGVDFKKGCYVGQEVTARMKHKTQLRKGLATVAVEGQASVGTELLASGKPAGVLYTQSKGYGIAYLRFDRATVPMEADTARVHWNAPAENQ